MRHTDTSVVNSIAETKPFTLKDGAIGSQGHITWPPAGITWPYPTSITPSNIKLEIRKVENGYILLHNSKEYVVSEKGVLGLGSFIEELLGKK